MPRFTFEAPAGESPPPPFDVCLRCASDAEIMHTVVAEREKIPAERARGVQFTKVRHGSYDFAPRPVACISCARILSAEDD